MYHGTRTSIRSFLLVAGVFVLLVIPLVSYGGLDNPIDPVKSFADIFTNVVKFLLGLVAVVALVGIVWGGFLYMTAAGNESRLEQAKSTILFAIIGLIVAIGGFVIVNAVFEALGGGGGGAGPPGGGGGIPGGGGGVPF